MTLEEKVNKLFNNVVYNGILVGVGFCRLVYKLPKTEEKITVAITWDDDNYDMIPGYDDIESFKKGWKASDHKNDLLPGINIVTPSGARYPVTFEDSSEGRSEWAEYVRVIDSHIEKFQSEELDKLIENSWQ